MNSQTQIPQTFDPIWSELTTRHPHLSLLRQCILEAFTLCTDTLSAGGKILVCGNGGSASDSAHFVGELMKGFESKRPIPTEHRKALETQFGTLGTELANKLQGAIPAISLTESHALITAILNDTAGDMIFAQQVYGLAKPHDIVLGISTSGNSANVVNALIVAKTVGAKTIALVGPKGGKMAEIADCAIRAPGHDTPAVQESHLPIYHALALMLERQFFQP